MSQNICIRLVLSLGLVLATFQAGNPPLSAQTPAAKGATAKQAPAANTQATAAAGLDRQVEAELHQRLAKSKIGQDGLTAHVENGVIYLEGTTSVSQHKGAATRMAKSVMAKNPGVKRVVNNIKVSKLGSGAANRATITKPSKSFSEAPAWTPPTSGSTSGAPTASAAKPATAPLSAAPQPQAKTQPTPETQAGPRRVAVQWK
ncbi:MAG: BON domain-containing protein [Acidobacteriota bacterium]